jgi:hypothetical protein
MMESSEETTHETTVTEAGAAKPEPEDRAAEDEEEEEEDSFLEEMFETFAEDPYDSDCDFAYWTDGIGIRRERVGGKWQYREVSA